MSAPLAEAVITESDHDTAECNTVRDKWQDLIDRNLVKWGLNSSQFEDEGVEPPGRETITLAIQLAEQLRDSGLNPPDSVVPDANGGIVFERREDDFSEVFHVWDDGTIDYQRFHGSQLVQRQAVDVRK